jgi:hypothetical protein
MFKFSLHRMINYPVIIKSSQKSILTLSDTYVLKKLSPINGHIFKFILMRLTSYNIFSPTQSELPSNERDPRNYCNYRRTI